MTEPRILANVAASEIRARRDHWPQQIETGVRDAAEAQADFEAWHDIEALLAGWRTAPIFTGWDALHAAAQAAVETRTAAATAATKAGADNAPALGQRARQLAHIRAWLHDHDPRRGFASSQVAEPERTAA